MECGFRNCTIVHLKMIDILFAMRLFAQQRVGHRVLVKCDNEQLSQFSKQAHIWPTCKVTFWYVPLLLNIDAQYAHVNGGNNKLADILSR